MFGFKKRRHEKLRAQPTPPSWLEIARRNVPYVAMLTAAESEKLFRDVAVFLDEKTFEGCNGLDLDDEIRVTVAVQACLLLLGRSDEVFPGLDAILVYPDAYFADVERLQPDGTVVAGPEARHGEAWHRGAIVLSWDGVKKGARDVRDGRNLVLHEFAHQLDDQDGAVDGAPRLDDRSAYRAWARVFQDAFEAFQEDVQAQRKTVLDPYGATAPAEFFAVATEAFFEKPRQLAKRRPELYEQMKAFYRQDPAARYEPAGEGEVEPARAG